MTILVCGDRNWTNRDVIKEVLSMFVFANTRVVHGAARGADRIAGDVAKELGCRDVVEYPANWDLYGKRAGVIRNAEMLANEKPDLVIAFHDDIEQSKGTLDMVWRAMLEQVDYMVFNSQGEEYCPNL